MADVSVIIPVFNAEKTLRKAVEDMHLRAADHFVEHFLPAYGLDLDELSR